MCILPHGFSSFGYYLREEETQFICGTYTIDKETGLPVAPVELPEIVVSPPLKKNGMMGIDFTGKSMPHKWHCATKDPEGEIAGCCQVVEHRKSSGG